MNKDELSRNASYLYGRNWRGPLAAALGVDRSTVYRWCAGQLPVPRVPQLAILKLVDQKMEDEALVDLSAVLDIPHLPTLTGKMWRQIVESTTAAPKLSVG